MKLQFKHQQFQWDATNAVCDAFEGQPLIKPLEHSIFFIRQDEKNNSIDDVLPNHPVEIPGEEILANIRRVQIRQNLQPIAELEGEWPNLNLTVEMETGTGKTYVYIKTMYELHRRYGWAKFIIVVPNVAIREGVRKAFEMTEHHFFEGYGKKIRFFIYNSASPKDVEQFTTDSNINAMIINAQAFNRKNDTLRVSMNLDSFKGRRPIDVIAETRPILIIDEPQSVEGSATKEALKNFNPLFTLRYSATHRYSYNMVYRLDAMDAYNRKLVKKIAVKGISISGNTATNGYVYLAGINLSNVKNPTATIEFDAKGRDKIYKKMRVVKEGDNLYQLSKFLDEYKDGWFVTAINGEMNFIEFANGVKIFVGEINGCTNEELLRRIQIRETIISHIDRERQLFYKDIKVLSLFFIDEVKKYRLSNDKDGIPSKTSEDEKLDIGSENREETIETNGIYAKIFEEEYANAVENYQPNFGDEEYARFLKSTTAATAHSGYFSIDKKSNKFINGKIGRKEMLSDDCSAYDLIMKNKERLLDKAEPVRFIFSHSALREGWDNPNVFQICTLKRNNSDIAKRQEIGRGLRLCVNQKGERMDGTSFGDGVHDVNILTVIASESYESFVVGLQGAIAGDIAHRPKEISEDLFEGKSVRNGDGKGGKISYDCAAVIYESMIRNRYVEKGKLTEKYYSDVQNGKFTVEANVLADDIIGIIGTIYDSDAMKPENARERNVELKLDKEKLSKKEFQDLWNRINIKSSYSVDFDTDDLIAKSVETLNSEGRLCISKPKVIIIAGEMGEIKSKQCLESNRAFSKQKQFPVRLATKPMCDIKYDIVGKFVENTGLTRRTVAEILRQLKQNTFEMFKTNPEEFILRASNLINEQKATAVVEHIKYNKLDSTYNVEIFTNPTPWGNKRDTVATKKNICSHVHTDSENERKFVENLDSSENVSIYAKLPSGFFISTPMGKYTPDWAIVFDFKREGIKHIYFVAETKGTMALPQLRVVEKSKIECAKKHFAAITCGTVKSCDTVTYDIVESYEALLDKVMR
ncbi:MAG: DEAD/DEAH box helicase family protein [Puniceicoccales bacterium]|jgi:type III restriction enzyme|nr:DEAD/DEAH box helicase family protein [Puniceicoccales bacterium]